MIVVNAPLRVSLFGGGTDIPVYYNHKNGHVLSTTIDLGIKIVVNKTMNETVKVIYSEIEEVFDIEELKHDRVREVLKLFGIGRGVEIASFAPVSTKGTGLGSSSAYTVGLIKAIGELFGHNFTRHQIADMACRIEIDACKQPIGKQDQYASAFGGMNSMTFKKNGVEVIPVECNRSTLEELNFNMIMMNTGMTRSTGDILSSLQDSENRTPEWFEIMNKINDLQAAATALLRKNKIDDAFGYMLNEGWLLKRQMADGVSNPWIDETYDAALSAGALGGKILGAGGGGFFLFFVPGYVRYSFLQAMRKRGLHQFDYKFTDEGTKVLYVG